MTTDKFSLSVDLTNEIGATVTVYDWSERHIHLSMGGDLHISIGMEREGAVAMAKAILEADKTLGAKA